MRYISHCDVHRGIKGKEDEKEKKRGGQRGEEDKELIVLKFCFKTCVAMKFVDDDDDDDDVLIIFIHQNGRNTYEEKKIQ